jgi:hypothetical protein
MNRTQKRLFAVLSAAIVLTGAALAVKYAKPEENIENPQQTQVNASPLSQESGTYKAISYWNGSTTLSFSRNEAGDWIWSEDPDFPLDPAHIEKIEETLSQLKPQQTLKEPEELESYGLDEPSQTLTATAQNGAISSIQLGKTTMDGDSYYMLMNESETPVYIISDQLAKEMSIGIYDMCRLPEFPDWADDSIQSVTLSDGENTTVVPNIQDTNIRLIINQILNMELSSCVDYRPSEGAVLVCGFGEPSAVVTVRDGSEEPFVLTIGNATLDETGRYVRFPGDTTIYSMKNERLAILMQTAENGISQ